MVYAYVARATLGPIGFVACVSGDSDLAVGGHRTDRVDENDTMWASRAAAQIVDTQCRCQVRVGREGRPINQASSKQIVEKRE